MSKNNEKKTSEELNKIFEEKIGKTFKSQFNIYRTKLIWYLMKMVPDQVEAEEVADEAFIKAFYEIEKYNETKSKFCTWLFTIARNVMIHRIKSKSMLQSIEADHDGATIGDFLYSDDGSKKIEKEKILEKKVQLIKKEISKLPEKYATVLNMREIESLSYNDISECLDLNLNTVKSQIKQGRAMLAKILEPKFKLLDEVGII